MKATHIIAFILVIVGGLNWGLVGIGGNSWNVVAWIFGAWPVLLSIVYVLVGISAIILAVTHCKTCNCKGSDAKSSAPTM